MPWGLKGAVTLMSVSSEPEAMRLELSSRKATAFTSSSWPRILRVVCMPLLQPSH